jgi:hypothetical protein
MTNAAIYVLRGLLIIVALGLFLGQVWVIPSLASELAYSNPEFAYLQVPYIVVAVAVLLCGQLVLGCIWVLLSRVREGEIFTASAFPVVDTVIVLLLVATALDLGVFVHLLVFVGQMNPGFGLVLLAGLFGGLALTLLMYVMRSLLKRATELEHDLSEVV